MHPVHLGAALFARHLVLIVTDGPAVERGHDRSNDGFGNLTFHPVIIPVRFEKMGMPARFDAAVRAVGASRVRP